MTPGILATISFVSSMITCVALIFTIRIIIKINRSKYDKLQHVIDSVVSLAETSNKMADTLIEGLPILGKLSNNTNPEISKIFKELLAAIDKLNKPKDERSLGVIIREEFVNFLSTYNGNVVIQRPNKDNNGTDSIDVDFWGLSKSLNSEKLCAILDNCCLIRASNSEITTLNIVQIAVSQFFIREQYIKPGVAKFIDPYDYIREVTEGAEPTDLRTVNEKLRDPHFN